MNRFSTFRGVTILALQAGLIFVLVGAGWLIYRQLPEGAAQVDSAQRTTLQIFIKQTPDSVGQSLDVDVTLYPFDIVAVRNEFFTETRPGKRYEDFLKERMKGRAEVKARLDKQGSGSVQLPPGSWWLHATISGDEQLEWHLPVTVTGTKQVIELKPQNAYTRSKTF